MTSKYSALPDIDDQPDVYETPDVSEENPMTSFDDQESDDANENLIKTRVSMKEATGRFSNSVVIADDTDFSDRLSRRKKAMYRTFVRRPPGLETSEYELLPKDMALEETSLQKLRRLMFEVQELTEHIEKKEDADTESQQVANHNDSMLSQLSYLQSDLTRLQQGLGQTEQEQGPSGYEKRIEEAKQLIHKLEVNTHGSAPTLTAATVTEETEAESSDKNNVAQEPMYTSKTTRLHKQHQVNDLDERISKIEKLVGSSAGQGLEAMPPSLSAACLISAMSKLEQQITILAQPRQLEMVARRIKVLNSELDRLNELKSGRKENTTSLGFGLGTPGILPSGLQTTAAALEGQPKEGPVGLSNEAEEKVNHLFATMEKIDPLLNLTPALLTRLKALQGLHTEASTFGRSVKMISEEQNQMKQELKSLTATCDTLNQSLLSNEENIHKNIKVVDDRMTELVQRVSALTSA